MKRLRALVIEDDPDTRRLLKRFLEKDGFEVRDVPDASKAFLILGSERYDVVLTDIHMRGLSGLEVLPGIQRLQPEGAVIFLSAICEDKVKEEAMAKGAAAFLCKPVGFKELIGEIHKALATKARLS